MKSILFSILIYKDYVYRYYKYTTVPDKNTAPDLYAWQFPAGKMGKNAAIIVSERDAAGMTIRKRLLGNYGFTQSTITFDNFPVYELPIEDWAARLYTIKSDSIHAEGIDKKIQADLFIFATRHVSKAGVPALTTHAVGNWGNAEYGGRDGTVCPTFPSLLKLFLQNLDAVAESEGYKGDVVQESTHHGPFIGKPCVFIELGSSEKEWQDEKLALMVADSLIGGLGDFTMLEAYKEKHVPVVALGGPHYGTNFRKLMLDSEHAVGHICPKHHLASLTPELLRQALDASGASSVVLDWKGLGQEKQRILTLLEGGGIEYSRI